MLFVCDPSNSFPNAAGEDRRPAEDNTATPPDEGHRFKNKHAPPPFSGQGNATSSVYRWQFSFKLPQSLSWRRTWPCWERRLPRFRHAARRLILQALGSLPILSASRSVDLCCFCSLSCPFQSLSIALGTDCCKIHNLYHLGLCWLTLHRQIRKWIAIHRICNWTLHETLGTFQAQKRLFFQTGWGVSWFFGLEQDVADGAGRPDVEVGRLNHHQFVF